MAERAMAWYHNVPFVRASWTPMLPLAVNRCSEEVSSWIHARRVDVVVLGVLAHFEGCEY